MTLRRIDRVEELHRYLQTALQLEHSTIPPYMTALYSIQPDTNSPSAQILHLVVVEEMLHLALVANILNAVGGSPDLTVPGFVPSYPTHLPDGETDFEVGVLGFSPEAIDSFLQIERPTSLTEGIDLVNRERSSRALLPSYRDESDTDLHFYSIGEFYQEIERGLIYLDAEADALGTTLFTGNAARQVTTEFRYDGGGEIIVVTDLDSALEAINLICEQGEGLGGAIYDEEDELSHYFRFEQILLGRYYEPGDEPGHPSGADLEVDWSHVHPIIPNARIGDFPENTELRERATMFAEGYQAFLGELTRAFNGEPENMDRAVGTMYSLKSLVLELVASPVPGRIGANGAPVFTGSN